MNETTEKERFDALLARAATYCARAERHRMQVWQKLAQWCPEADEACKEMVMDVLMKERYIDHRRYAEAYVTEKHRLSLWGPYKIRMELRARGLEEPLVEEALKKIAPDEWLEALQKTLTSKMSQFKKNQSSASLWQKLYNYGYTKGYTAEQIRNVLSDLELEEENDF